MTSCGFGSMLASIGRGPVGRTGPAARGLSEGVVGATGHGRVPTGQSDSPHTMTSAEYTTLMDFLATGFARMDTRFDRLEARQDALEASMSRLEARQEALETRMDGLDARQGSVEARLSRSEVLWESMRHEIRLLAEGMVALSERLDRRFDGIQVQFDRFAVDFGTVQLDHGARLQALEGWRRAQGSRG